MSRTRLQIVSITAERLRRSPEPVTLVEIAAAAGVSRTTVYRHFRSITGLLDAVAADLLARARFDQLLAAISLPDPVGALASVIRLGCGIWALDPDLVRNLTALARAQADVLPVIDQLEAGRVQIMERLVQRLEQADRADRPHGSASRHLSPACRPARLQDVPTNVGSTTVSTSPVETSYAYPETLTLSDSCGADISRCTSSRTVTAGSVTAISARTCSS
ncbi:MAG TPA: TetR/AcrR family transcriptional regulator [Streptosporangiaceae bacterium]|nr:TetR/AcrR family transcriptional regulator [Streptosporangiaceae bacterium]